MTTTRAGRMPGKRPGADSGRARRALAGVAAGALGTACVLGAGLSSADDTEVYFAQVNSGGIAESKPNVLFVLDTSGSMGSTDGTGQTRLARMQEAMRSLLQQAEGINVGLMKFNGFYGGGPVLFPVSDLDAERCSGTGCRPVATSAAIAQDSDDVEEYLDSNWPLLGGSVLDLPKEGSRQQAIGLRFANLAVPRGATIVDARLDLTAYDTRSGGSLSLRISAEDTDDAQTFGTSRSTVTGRSWRTGETADWALGDWTRHETYASVNLSDVIQQVTDSADWCGGNAVALKLEQTPGTIATTVRRAMTFKSAANVDGVPPPTLRVSYRLDELPEDGGCMRTSTTSLVEGSSDDAEESLRSRKITRGSSDLDVNGGVVSGVRFRNVDVPRGARVRQAWLEFEVSDKASGTSASALSILVRGEDSDNASAYRNRKRDITSRPTTDEYVVWQDVPNAASGATLRSDDIAPIVQEIVDRGRWKAGNALALTLYRSGGSGERELATYNHSNAQPPRLVIEYDDESASDGLGGSVTVTARDELLGIVDTFVASGGTPIVESLYEAAQYYRGGPVDFGTARGVYSRQHNRVSHPDSYTGGTHVVPSDCKAANPSSKDCVNERITGDPVYVSPITGSCQTNHVVLLSDGAATSNVAAARARALMGAASCEKRDNGTEECGVELGEWLATSDLSSTIAGRQDVTTHTIAFNLDDPTFLQDIAKAGEGRFFEADDADELLGAFRSILEGASSIDTSFTAPGATVNQFNRLTHRDDIYFAMFKPADTPRWRGNLKRFRIGAEADSADGEVSGEVVVRDRYDNPAVNAETGFFSEEAFSFWPEKDTGGTPLPTPDGHDVARGGAANQLVLTSPELGARRAYTWIGEASAVPSGGVELAGDTRRSLHEDNALITGEILRTGVLGTGILGDAYRDKLLAWSRGVDVDDEDGDGSRTDARRHMGDPMHSRPVILNYAAGTAPDGTASAQRSIVFVATNEGYLHAIDTADGSEQFAFMPRELLGNLDAQYRNDPSDDHVYGIDGPLSVWRTDPNENYIVDPGEKAYLYFGLRRGGYQYYALDISDLHEPRLAWAIQGGEEGSGAFAELGQTWSRMTPVRMQIDGEQKDVLLFGGGYDEQQDPEEAGALDSLGLSLPINTQRGRGLFIVEATTGKLLWSGLGKAGAGASQVFGDMDYPIPGNLRAIDVNRDGLVDQIYAADTGGQLWRFDVKQYHGSEASDNSSNLMVGGVVADLSGTSADSRRRFYAEPDVALIEQDGKRFLTVSIGSGWRAHPLDRTTEDRFYVIRQSDVSSGPGAGRYGIEDEISGLHRPITETDLVAITDELDPEVGANGWYLDFARPGEKVLGASVTFDSSVIFTTYVPEAASSDCSVGIGGGRAYMLDVVSGAPSQDLDEDDDIDEEDQSIELKHSGLPPEATILMTEDGGDEPTVLAGPQVLPSDIRNATTRTFWSDRGPAGDAADPVVQAEGDEEAE